MLISPTPPMQKVALEVPGVKAMALAIAHAFPRCERQPSETLQEFAERQAASVRLAGALARTNPDVVDVILEILRSP